MSKIYGKIFKNILEDEYKDLEATESAEFSAGRYTNDHCTV